MHDVNRARFGAQLLAGPPARSVGQVVDRLLAVQAQDPRAARLGVRARSAGLAAADVDAALARRELVVSWLNRGTLHLVRAEDLPWLHALTTPQLSASNARRLAEEGVSPAQADRGVETVERALADGPRTRSELQELLDAAGVPTAGQALVHVLLLATLREVCVRGPVAADGRGSYEQAFVLLRKWLPAPPAVDREVALGELARRYLLGHGPSSDRDLAKWAGIPLGDARRGLALARAVRWPADDPGAAGGDLLLLPGGPAPQEAPQLPPPRLLGAFDELLMGWKSREPVLGDSTTVVTKNGIFRAIAVADGRAVGTWRLLAGKVLLEPFSPLAPAVTTALDIDAEDVRRFLGSD